MRVFIAGPSILFDTFTQECVGKEALEALVDGIPSVRIVLADSSRASMTITEIRNIFPVSVRANVEGVLRTAGSDGRAGSRQHEIEQYIAEMGSAAHLVVDSDPDLYEEGYPFLYQVDRDVPLSEQHASEIVKRLAKNTDPVNHGAKGQSMSAGPLLRYPNWANEGELNG